MARLGRRYVPPIVLGGHAGLFSPEPVPQRILVVNQAAHARMRATRPVSGRAQVYGLRSIVPFATTRSPIVTVDEVRNIRLRHQQFPSSVQGLRSIVPFQKTGPPIVRSTSRRVPGRSIVIRNPGQPGPQGTSPIVRSVSSRRPGRIVVLGQRSIVPFQFPQPKPIVRSTSSRRPGVAVVLRGHPGLILTASTRSPIVVTSSQRRAGRSFVGGLRSIVPFAFPQPQPIVRTTSSRRAGRAIVAGGRPGLIITPTTPKPIVVTSSTRRAGRVVVLGLRSIVPFATTRSPIVVSTSRRAVGRAVILRNPAAPVVVTPRLPAQPIVVSFVYRRGGGRIFVGGRRSIVPFAFPQPQPIVRSTSRRNPGRAVVLRNPGQPGPARQPIVRSSSTRRAGRAVILRNPKVTFGPFKGTVPIVVASSHAYRKMLRRAVFIQLHNPPAGLSGPGAVWRIGRITDAWVIGDLTDSWFIGPLTDQWVIGFIQGD